MSNIYVYEPSTSGKVLLASSIGDLEIELWPKEAPLACRRFVRRCLEGYYDDSIFHRIIVGFVAQGGYRQTDDFDAADDDDAEPPPRIEIHQRLKFTRRGLVACAFSKSDVKKSDDDEPLHNRDQFFITLDATPDLDGKHTIFGKLSARSVFHVSRFAELEIDAHDRPRYPPTIRQASIVAADNPFPELDAPAAAFRKRREGELRELKRRAEHEANARSRPQGSKNFQLLSFGDEAEEEQSELDNIVTSGKSKSAHDIANDPTLSSQAIDVTPDEAERKAAAAKEAAAASEIARQQRANRESEAEKPLQTLRRQVDELKRELVEVRNVEAPADSNTADQAEPQSKTVLEYNRSKEQYRKANQAQKSRWGDGAGKREEETMRLLARFRSRLGGDDAAKQQATPVAPDADDGEVAASSDDVGLVRHALKFDDEPTPGEDSLVVQDPVSKARDASKKREIDDYDLYDPRNPLVRARRNAVATEWLNRADKRQRK